MRLSLSTISTVNAAFEDEVRAYAAAGFDAIGVWERKLPADDAGNRALLAEHGLSVSNCVPTVPSFLPLGIPVACGFPVGHIDDQWTLPLGVRARLDAEAGELELLEPAVSPGAQRRGP